jgi:hypothetical protein
MPAVSGHTKEEGVAVSRLVRVYLRSTGALLAQGWSDNTGYFSISVPDTSLVFVVALDDPKGTLINARVYDRITPL